jgi:cell division protein FtsW
MPTAPAISVLTGILCTVGLVMVGSSSTLVSVSQGGAVWSIFEKQVLWMLLGAVLALIAVRVNYHLWQRLSRIILLVTLGLLVMVLMTAPSVDGAGRWIGVGMLKIQPSELMKLALVVFVADLLTRRADRSDEPRMQIGPVVLVLGLAGLLVMAQPDMGTTMVLVFIAFAVMFMAGVKTVPLAKTAGVFFLLAVGFTFSSHYRKERFFSFLHQSGVTSGAGYQVSQSKVYLGSGHTFGVGLLGGQGGYTILPNAHTDFIFSIIGEELGLVGALAVMGLFFALALFGYRAALRAPDRFGSLMAMGITTWIITQAVINIGTDIGVMPVTGIPLPFISYGGTSLVVNLMAMGILVNIAMKGDALAASGQVTPLRPSKRPRPVTV